MSLPILDVAIGLSFIYLLLSLICTSINELLAGVLNLRGKYLEMGITRLLNGSQTLKEAIYAHPLVDGTTMDGKSRRPAYISSNRFAMALMDHLSGEGKSRTDLESVRSGIEKLEQPQLKVALKALLPDSLTHASEAQRLIEEWFNEGMDRVSGWYKRNAQVYVVALAVVVTLGLNADSLHIARVLWINPALRAQLIDAASVRLEKDRPEEMLPLVEYRDPDDPTKSEAVVTGRAALSQAEQDLLTQVMGWDGNAPATGLLGWFAKIVGWLMTIAALSLGAPFWFDALKRIMNVRNAGRSPVEPREKAA